jgi:Zn-dependent M16 (insulinase) family peptidase
MSVINDFLYGPEDGSELEPSLDEFTQMKELRQWTSKQWTDMLQKYCPSCFELILVAEVVNRYYIDPNAIVVRGKPSSALADKLEKDEKSRIAEQAKQLGKTGLEKAAAELETAKKEHDREIPTDILTSFPVPNVKSISWMPVQSLQDSGKGRPARQTTAPSEELTKHIQADGSALPFFVQYDYVKVRSTVLRSVQVLYPVLVVRLRHHPCFDLA